MVEHKRESARNRYEKCFLVVNHVTRPASPMHSSLLAFAIVPRSFTSLQRRMFAKLAIATAAAASVALAASPIPGFRPPSVPLFMQSPLVNVWSPADHLYDTSPTQWTGLNQDFFSAIRVDGVPYLLMGSPSVSWSTGNLQTATQTSLNVYATQTKYTFNAGAVSLAMTFTSPLITDDWELLSRPVSS